MHRAHFDPPLRREGHRRTSVARAVLLVTVAALLELPSGGGCSRSKSPPRPEPGPQLLYGSLVTPVTQHDPYLDEAYRTLSIDGNDVAHFAISWGAVDRSNGVRDWLSLDQHIEKARLRGTKISLAFEFIHGGVADFPSYHYEYFPGWSDPDLLVILSGILREVKQRFPAGDSRHDLAYLWLGEGPDRFAIANPDGGEGMLAFYGALADSARRIFPYAKVGTIITPGMIGETQGEPLIRALEDSLDVLGLSVFPQAPPQGVAEPTAALQTMVADIAPWEGKPFAILEAGYPSAETLGSSEEKQTAFATLVAQWLKSRPATLELFCWSPLSDAGTVVIDSLAGRRFPRPEDGSEREDFARRIATMSMHRIDGSVKPALHEWVDRRP
jgi:hypothetical protein